jgi:hypothetical protein
MILRASAILLFVACARDASAPAAPVASLAVTPDSVTLRVGESAQLSATARDASGSALTGRPVTWTSDDPEIASVSPAGLVTALSSGTASVTARTEGASASVDVSVTPADFRPAADLVLRGAMTFADVNIAEGVTVRAEGDVTIEATGSFTLNGVLAGDCAGITVKSGGAVTMNGAIRNTCSAESGQQKSVTIVGNGPLTLGPGRIETSGDVFISNDSTVSSEIALQRVRLQADAGAASIVLASASVDPCDLNGFASVPSPVRAPDGTSGPRGGNGTPGGSVVLYCSGDARIQGVYIQAQDGGHGGTATHSSTTFAQATGGQGGRGGEVFLGGFGGENRYIGNNTLLSGNGGNGGDAIASGLPNNTPAVAASAEALGGDGERPGDIRFGFGRMTDASSGQINIVVGSAGSGGDATARGADGVDALTRSGPAQHGGGATATGGAAADGLSGGIVSFNTQPGFDILAGNGGNGGRAFVVAGDGGDGSVAAVDGGDGGNLGAMAGDGGNGAFSPATNTYLSAGGTGADVSFTGGNGGNGATRCAPAPIGQGGRGGAGGEASGKSGQRGFENPVLFGTTTVDNAGNGGDGGDGSGPGAAGQAGANTIENRSPYSITGSFATGRPGVLCPGGTFGVDISPVTMTINVGQTFVFTCTVTDLRTGMVIASPALDWSSSAPGVATAIVGGTPVTGVTFGVSPGLATITCRLPTGEAASAELMVISPADPLCDPQQTPQADDARQVVNALVPGLGVIGFCHAATLNLFTGSTKHSSGTEAPRPRVMDHTSFNIVGAMPATMISAADLAAFTMEYPCGLHAHGRTLCQGTGSTLPPGEYVIAFGVMNGAFPAADPSSVYEYGFVFDADDNLANNFVADPNFPNDFFQSTDRWYTFGRTPSQNWGLNARTALNNSIRTVATAARIVMIDQTAILIVPRTEFGVPDPAVRFTAFRHDGRFGFNGFPWSGDVQRPVNEPLYSVPISDLPEIEPPPAGPQRARVR